MSDTSRRNKWRVVKGNRPVPLGFTLFEMLVVLAIAALLASLAMPGLRQLARSVEYSGQRKAIMSQLEGLGYRAYSQAKPVVLTSLPDAGRDALHPSVIDLPAGWRLQVEEPIRYEFNGQCRGGKLALISPDARSEAFILRPPLCRLEPQA